MSKESLVNTIESFEAGWGKIITWVVRLLLIPLMSLGLYSATLYLDNHYVPRTYFDSSMDVLSADKKACAADVKASFGTVNEKLDVLIISGASNVQKFADFERRLNKVEEKVDSLRK